VRGRRTHKTQQKQQKQQQQQKQTIENNNFKEENFDEDRISIQRETHSLRRYDWPFGANQISCVDAL
jgi:hypothetical protein